MKSLLAALALMLLALPAAAQPFIIPLEKQQPTEAAPPPPSPVPVAPPQVDGSADAPAPAGAAPAAEAPAANAAPQAVAR